MAFALATGWDGGWDAERTLSLPFSCSFQQPVFAPGHPEASRIESVSLCTLFLHNHDNRPAIEISSVASSGRRYGCSFDSRTVSQSLSVAPLLLCWFFTASASAGIVSDVLSGALPTFYAVTMVQ